MAKGGGAKTKKNGPGLFGLGMMLFVLLLIFGGTVFTYFQFMGPGPKEMTEVTFPHGMSVRAMGKTLEKKGVIHSAFLFRMAAQMRGHTSNMKAGTYDFPAGVTLLDALAEIEQGKVVQTLVTIPEGKTSAQVVRILMATPRLTGDVDVPPEGALLPETYLYQPGETRQAVLDRMLEAGRNTLDELWAKRAPGLPFANKEEALIMASIVERETGVASERPRVAAVFINRLRQGIRLGSDPTVIYGISHGEPLGRGLTRAELDTPTPWNTYLIDKLPVTPIANPGRASLEATLNPAKTNDLYFVANGTGGHAFAATYEEHQANVAKWRAMEGKVEVYTTAAVPPTPALVKPPESLPSVIKPAAKALKHTKVKHKVVTRKHAH